MLSRIVTSVGHYRLFLIYCTILFSIYVLYIKNVSKVQKNQTSVIKHPNPNKIYKHNFVIDTPTCQIPHMSPFDPAVSGFITHNKPYFCSYKERLIISNDTHLIFNYDAYGYYSLDLEDHIECYFQYFWIIEPHIDEENNLLNKVKFGERHYFNETAKMDEEFVQVICENRNKEVFKDFYAFILTRRIEPKIRSTGRKLNVLIIGLDSISRLNFHRQMPLTKDYLKSIGGIEYFGYNKIADNTFPNLIRILTGMNETEVVKTCLRKQDSRLDNCPFIWNDFQEHGYVTAFAEEANGFGVFTPTNKGFYKQPVTHMWGPFHIITQEMIGYVGRSKKRCQGYRLALEYLLEYNLRFVRAYQKIDQNYFGLFWESIMTHDDINYDSRVDRLYLELLQNLTTEKTFDNTILFFMGDHGMRYGKIAYTPQGRLEDRLPLFFVVTPKWFQLKYPKAQRNLQINSRRLTSHWDMRETLKSIFRQDFSAESFTKSGRGLSLFSSIPINRTCEMAGIVPHWCICYKYDELSLDDKMTQFATTFVISHINWLLSNHTKCAKVLLRRITDASIYKSQKFDENLKEIYYIYIGFLTVQRASFEATVKCSECDKLKNFELGGPITRINIYRHQGDCIQEPELRLYCYCQE